ncbi:MAG: IS66 family transposase [Actinobacteria bacterium]|nr:IS66 family transposase [Gemmatimonadaceae bacterium]MBA3844874.1 IS66 family transposase [Actinomycetota bacterium]
MIEDASPSSDAALATRVVELETALARERIRADEAQQRADEAHQRADEAIAERDRLREGFHQLQLEVELARRRLVVAKAERVDTLQLQLEFAAKLRELDELAGLQPGPMPDPDVDNRPPSGKRNGKAKPKGRRKLSELDMPEERVELTDPALEGTAERIGSEDSFKLMWRRAGYVRLVVSRAKYKIGEGDNATIATTELPRELITRSLAAPALLAHIASDKLCDGLPLHRQEDRFARLGARIDRGTMSRWLEELGMSVGATIVAAMRDDAFAHAFCISTDATGVLVQPIPSVDKMPRSCHRGHYFVQIADRDHVFFEYRARETSAVVGELFRGFSGYIQADAKSVYDALFRPPPDGPALEDNAHADLGKRHEVGCWAHARRKFWEAAITKDPIAREGLARIGRIFELDRSWKKRSAVEIKSMRDEHLRAHTDAFFAWVAVEYERVRGQRGLLRTALGYAHRQQGPLNRFYDDGRLKLDNNASERELRRIAVGRKNWLFVGSDDHAQAAGNLLTLIASARLHGLDPEAYLRDVFRVLPYWPRGRFLELCPRDWMVTRARLIADELDRELGPVTVPEPSTATTE